MIIDGEILDFKCKDCGSKFKHFIEYGPMCPNCCLEDKCLKRIPLNVRNAVQGIFLRFS